MLEKFVGAYEELQKARKAEAKQAAEDKRTYHSAAKKFHDELAEFIELANREFLTKNNSKFTCTASFSQCREDVGELLTTDGRENQKNFVSAAILDNYEFGLDVGVEDENTGSMWYFHIRSDMKVLKQATLDVGAEYSDLAPKTVQEMVGTINMKLQDEVETKPYALKIARTLLDVAMAEGIKQIEAKMPKNAIAK